MPDDERALRDRLNQLVRDRSRSEVARRTGTSLMNVSRYLGGTRVPAAFCIALCREFGVNPSWLLTGQGPLSVADVAQDQSQTAGDLLKLVEALGAVSRMRLGSLAGDRGLKMMRELDDALGAHERLRAKLNLRASDLLGRVLTELEVALRDIDLPRAAALLGSATQLARLTDDEALGARLLAVQAHHAFLMRRMDKALSFMRKRFGLALAGGGLNTPEGLEMGLRLGLTLQDAGLADEARRTLEAILAYADSAARRLPSYAVCACAHGTILVESGRLPDGIAALKQWTPACDARRAGNALAGLMRAQVLAGELPLRLARDAPGLEPAKWIHLASLAAVAEDAEFLREGAAYFDSPQGRVPRERSVLPHYAGVLARILQGRAQDPGAELQRAKQSATEHGIETELTAIVHTTALRLAGDRKGARAAHRQARTALASAGTSIEFMAMHLRNALLLGPTAAERAEADKFFTAAGAGGYRFIAELRP